MIEDAVRDRFEDINLTIFARRMVTAMFRRH
jgi:hypothetical protein